MARAGVETRKAVALASLGVAVAVVSSVLAWSRVGAGYSVALLIASVLVYRLASRRLDATIPWIRGGRSEEAIGLELERLRPDGFSVAHDIEQAGEGNIDHLVSGPTGVFLVESKHRRYDEAHLKKARRQAAKVHDELDVWVTPVICLDQRDQQPFRTQGVWVLGRKQVVAWIAAQRNPPGDPGLVARFVGRV